MTDATLATREAVRAHYGEMDPRVAAKEFPRLDKHARAFIGLGLETARRKAELVSSQHKP